MIWLVGAIAWALLAYGLTTRHLLPVQRATADGRRERTRKSATKTSGWSATRRAMRLLGWTPERLRMLSILSASAVGLLWLLWVQNPLSAGAMAYLGWQLPAWWVESRASRGMATLHRQFAEFVSIVHDQMHSRGATVERALASAADTLTTGPLSPVLLQFKRQTGAKTPLAERLTKLREGIDMPVADFFIQLLRLKDQTGTEDISHAFDSLDEKLQDDERVMATIQGEVRMHSLFLVLGFLVNLAVFPIYRLDPTDWAGIHTHLQILVTGSALVSVVVFSGIRRFTRAQLEAGATA